MSEQDAPPPKETGPSQIEPPVAKKDAVPASPSPPDRISTPPTQDPSSGPDFSPPTLHADSEIANRLAVAKTEQKRKQMQAERDAARKFREYQLRQAEERARQLELERSTALELAELENDKLNIELAREAASKERPISKVLVDRTKDKKIQDELYLARVAQEAKGNFEKEESRLTTQLATLLQLAGTAMQFGANMQSMNGQGPSAATTPDANSSLEKPAGLSTGRSPSSLENSAISETNPDGSGAKPGKDSSVAETAAATNAAEKELDAVEKDLKLTPAQKEKLRKAIRAKLRAKLQKIAAAKMAANYKKNGKGGKSDDPTALFNGNLLASKLAAGETARSDLEEASIAAAANARSSEEAYTAAMQARFSLAGEETDAEVNRMVAEASDELSNDDRKNGIMPKESSSLFERVKKIHDTCALQKCVASRN